jgi:hypothetical protein
MRPASSKVEKNVKNDAAGLEWIILHQIRRGFGPMWRGNDLSWDLNIATLLALGAQFVMLVVVLTRTNIRANEAHRLAESLDERLRKVEAEHVLGMALRQDFREFQNSVSEKIDALRLERREDMNGLHNRLNEILMMPRAPAE